MVRLLRRYMLTRVLSVESLKYYGAMRQGLGYFTLASILLAVLFLAFGAPLQLTVVSLGCVVVGLMLLALWAFVGYEVYWHRQFRVSQWDWILSWYYPDNAKDLVIRIRVRWKTDLRFFWGAKGWHYFPGEENYFKLDGGGCSPEWLAQQPEEFNKGLILIRDMTDGAFDITAVDGGAALKVADRVEPNSVIILDFEKGHPMILDEIVAAHSVERFFDWCLSDQERLKEAREKMVQLRDHVQSLLTVRIAAMQLLANDARRFKTKIMMLKQCVSMLRQLIKWMHMFEPINYKACQVYEESIRGYEQEIIELEARLPKSQRGLTRGGIQ